MHPGYTPLRRGLQPSSSVSSSFILQCFTTHMAALRYFRDVGKCQSARRHILEQHRCDNQECPKCVRRKISGEFTDHGFDGRDTVYSGRYKTLRITCCHRIHYMVMAGPYTASHPTKLISNSSVCSIFNFANSANIRKVIFAPLAICTILFAIMVTYFLRQWVVTLEY